jgi:hypothetical protein
MRLITPARVRNTAVVVLLVLGMVLSTFGSGSG